MGNSWQIDRICRQKKTPAFWTRLTKSKQKHQWLSIDWSKWADEDDDAGENLDTSYMNELGGSGPGDFDDEEDVDDEKDEPPDTTPTITPEDN